MRIGEVTNSDDDKEANKQPPVARLQENASDHNTSVNIESAPNHAKTRTDLYVSTDLWWFEQAQPHRLAKDFTWQGLGEKPRVYRKLSAQYYAWLRDQVEMVVTLELQGKISRKDLDETEVKWARIEQLVRTRVNQEVLEKAACPKGYRPPVVCDW